MLRENSLGVLAESASEMKINLLKAVSKIVTDLKQLYSRRAAVFFMIADVRKGGSLPNEIEKLNSSVAMLSILLLARRSIRCDCQAIVFLVLLLSPNAAQFRGR